MKWYVSGLVWIAPGRSYWEELGPFDTEQEAITAWGYRQGRPIVKQK